MYTDLTVSVSFRPHHDKSGKELILNTAYFQKNPLMPSSN